MATDLQLDDELTAVTSITASATGWATAVQTLLRGLAHSTTNPFGSAATVDTGADSGDVPLLGTGGKLAVERLPTGTAASQVPLLDASARLPRATLPAASETDAGAVRLATGTEGQSTTEAGVALTPQQLHAALAALGYPRILRHWTGADTVAGSWTEFAGNGADFLAALGNCHLIHITGDDSTTANSRDASSVWISRPHLRGFASTSSYLRFEFSRVAVMDIYYDTARGLRVRENSGQIILRSVTLWQVPNQVRVS